MQAKDKTKSQLIAEMAELQQRHAALEAVDTRRQQAEALLVEQAHLAALGAEVASILTERAALQDMLQRCADLMVRRLNAVLARIWTLSEADGVLVLQASAGLYTHTNGAHSRVPIGTFKIGRIAQNRQPHLTNSVAADPYISDPEWARREGIVAFAGHPLIIDDRVVGVMALFARDPLTEGVLVALASVADRIALGIERKRAEEALRNNEQIFRALFEHSPDGILLIDPCSPDGPWTIVDCNDVACRMNGYTREELIGQSIDLLNANPS